MHCWCAGASSAWGMAMRSGVRLRLTGGMPERFIEKALAQGVCIRNCCRIDDRVAEMDVARRDAAKVQALAQTYGVGCEVLEVHGWSLLAEGMLRRRTAIIGVLALLGMSALLLSRVWMVQVLPVDDTDPAVLAQVRQVLAESGAVPGASLLSLDRAELRARLISAVPQAGYVSVKRKGVCIVAEVSQAIEPPQTYDIGAARDIVAMHDAVVQRVDVYAGTAAVAAGDTVRRGDILILGSERASGEEAKAVSAEGAVIARLWRSAEVRAALQETVQVPTGRRSVSEELHWPGGTLALSEAEGYACEQLNTEFLPVGGVFVPVGIQRTIHAECREEIRPRDDQSVKRLLLEEAEAILEENMPFGARVIDKWEDYSMIDSGILYMKLTYELEADIAASGRPEQQEERNWSWNASPNT